MFNKRIKITIKILGLLIFFYILFKIDYQLFLKEIRSLRWYFLVLAVGLISFEIIIRSLRWRTILLSLDINISKLNCINLHWLGLFIGTITPGRLGELIKIYFLKNRGYSVFRSFFSIILDRTFDIFILLLFGLLIFFFFLKDIGIYVISFGIILLLVILFIFLLVNQKSYLHRLFGRLVQKIFPVDFRDYSHFTFAKFWQGIKNLKKKQVIYFFVYLVFSWFIYFSARYVIALSLGMELSFISIAIISVLTALVTILPISVAGLGTREAAVIYLFSLFDLNKEVALLFSLLIFTIDILVVSFGLIPYLNESSLINRVKKI